MLICTKDNPKKMNCKIGTSGIIITIHKMNFILQFKTANGNGLLMLMGDEQDGDFVSIELVNQVVRYKYVVTKHLSIQSV